MAELLEVGERTLALRILPAALPRLVELEQRAEIAALAAAVGVPVQQMCRERVHHIVAKVMFEGAGAEPAGMCAWLDTAKLVVTAHEESVCVCCHRAWYALVEKLLT